MKAIGVFSTMINSSCMDRWIFSILILHGERGTVQII